MSDARGPDVFARAQVRLALLFAGLVIVLVLVSTVFLYLSFSSDLRSVAQREFESGADEEEYVAQSLDTLRWRLIAVDAAIVVVVGLGGLLYARRTLRPIRDSVAAQKRFVADASHDLRTPLAIMKTDIEVALRNPELLPALRPVLERSLEEVDGMAAMVDDLLTLSRIDANQERLAIEPLDLAGLARETGEKLRSMAAAAGVALELPGVGVVPAFGDAAHLRRALANVLRNAIEHSPPGRAVEVAARRRGAFAELTVTDRGAGMPSDVAAHVFDRFYRADPSRAGSAGNSGLGLAIARWALRGMGGDITVESEVGAGTRVTLVLPASPH